VTVDCRFQRERGGKRLGNRLQNLLTSVLLQVDEARAQIRKESEQYGCAKDQKSSSSLEIKKSIDTRQTNCLSWCDEKESHALSCVDLVRAPTRNPIPCVGLLLHELSSPCRLAGPSLRGAAASMSAADGASAALIAGFAHATASWARGVDGAAGTGCLTATGTVLARYR